MLRSRVAPSLRNRLGICPAKPLAAPIHQWPRRPSSSRAPRLQTRSAATHPPSLDSAHLHRSRRPSRQRRSACRQLHLRTTTQPRCRPPPPAATPQRARPEPPGHPTCPCSTRPRRCTRLLARRCRTRPPQRRQPSRMLGRPRHRSSRSPPMRPSRDSCSSSWPSPSKRPPSSPPPKTRLSPGSCSSSWCTRTRRAGYPSPRPSPSPNPSQG